MPGKVSVPDNWKMENGGSYVQAPPPYKPLWWYTSPFSEAPWDSVPPPTPPLPPGFLAVFGAMPQSKDFPFSGDFRKAFDKWQHILAIFEKAGVPPWSSQEAIDQANKRFRFYLMGDVLPYKVADHDWDARFTGAPDFTVPATLALQYVALAVTEYQIQELQVGRDPTKGDKAKRVYLVPPELWADI